MKTEDLINALAASVEPAPPRGLNRRLVACSLVAGAGALVGVAVVLGFRPDLAVAVQGPMFWTKAGYTAALALCGGWLFVRLGRPGAPVRGPVIALATVALAVLAGAAVEFAGLPPAARLDAWLGGSARACPFNILLLSALAAPAVVWAARRFAPVRPGQAGAAAGLLTGALAATLYGLHCPESTLMFLATWYTLGVLLAAGLGALAGPRLLRW